MPDEYICQWCKEYDGCLERKRIEEEEHDIVVLCVDFKEVDDPCMP